MEETTEEPIEEIIDVVELFSDDYNNFGDHSICSF